MWFDLDMGDATYKFMTLLFGHSVAFLFCQKLITNY